MTNNRSNKFKAPNVIREIEDCIGKLVAHIDRKLIENNNQACQFNVNDFSHRYSLNLVFSCFYKQYNEIDFDDPDCEWTRMLDYTLEGLRSSKLVKLSMIFPKICGLIDWLMWNFHKESMYRRRILEFVKMQTKLGIEAREQLEERKRDGRLDEKIDTSNFMLKDGTNFRRNLIDHVVDQFLDGKITKRQYFNNSCFVVAAADKTSSDCIMHTIYMLSIHQDIQDKLRQSVKTNGAESEYLDWVLRESLRLFPPANIGCSRTTRRDIPLKNGYVVPAGTLVVTCAFVIHRLKEYWGEDAEEFRPERWQDTSKHHPLQFLTFGAGTRGCPGREFAMFELKMLFAALVSRYKFEGKRQDHIYQFDAPLLIFALPHEPTIVTIGRLEEQEC